ncbi:unnamed protein product, partial [Allacma fusca]
SNGCVFTPVGLLTLLLYLVVLSHTANISKKQVTPENRELNFFLRIQKLNLSWEEILGSYKNVSAEAKTQLCKGKCKTAMALWVLQHLKPCELIEKVSLSRVIKTDPVGFFVMQLLTITLVSIKYNENGDERHLNF